ncbi:unnamed protein product [Lactuca saligna]|uniref:Rab3GAP catalytic subunit conserved domain-containing protein n=1 Tax=Lactuca saligna TaxID=75948 RepID=A0AA35ZMA4_LACSI|nr:unnamed protein product [Lactuca saligna]
MSFPIFDGNVYLLKGIPNFLAKEDNSPAHVEVNNNIIPSSAVLKQLAIGFQTTKGLRSMKDLLASSRDSSPVKERSGLSLSAMKSFVVGEREDDKFSSEFGRNEKVMSFIHSLLNAEGNFSRKKVGSCLKTNKMITNFSKELHGAPAESFVTELAAVVGSLKTLRKMALFWSRVVLELRRLWCEGQYIPGIPTDEIPNLNSCLLYQDLQVINCCISRKQRRVIATQSLDAVPKQANRDPDLYAKISTGERVLRLGAHKRLENTTLLKTGEPVYTPIMQEGPLLTEEVIRETEELVLRTGSVGAGCSQLLSDMQAFKAANPGCILEDFVRWHSPPDWTETSTDDESKESINGDLSSSKGQLSTRMQKEGNLWRELWEAAKSIPAVKQSPLYDEDLSVEGILHGFENISPSGFFEQLFLSLLSSGCTIAEARISTNEDLYKLFKECKEYIIITCQGKRWVEKADDICKVYETVAMMALCPNGVIRITKPQPHEPPASDETKGGFGKVGVMFGAIDNSPWKTPPKGPKKQEDDTTAQASLMFSKKPPKPTEKQVGSIENIPLPQ